MEHPIDRAIETNTREKLLPRHNGAANPFDIRNGVFPSQRFHNYFVNQIIISLY